MQVIINEAVSHALNKSLEIIEPQPQQLFQYNRILAHQRIFLKTLICKNGLTFRQKLFLCLKVVGKNEKFTLYFLQNFSIEMCTILTNFKYQQFKCQALEFPNFDKNYLIPKRTSGHLGHGENARKIQKIFKLDLKPDRARSRRFYYHTYLVELSDLGKMVKLTFLKSGTSKNQLFSPIDIRI